MLSDHLHHLLCRFFLNFARQQARRQIIARAGETDQCLPFPLPFNTAFNACPVYDFLFFATPSGVPSATIFPPPSPPSGPRSITQSADLITSRLCSIMITVLPRSTSRCSTSSSLRTSSKCRPVV